MPDEDCSSSATAAGDQESFVRQERPTSRVRRLMEAILTAILEDDRHTVKELLKVAPELATRLINEASLYESKIVHLPFQLRGQTRSASFNTRTNVTPRIMVLLNIEGIHRWHSLNVNQSLEAAFWNGKPVNSLMTPSASSSSFEIRRLDPRC
jgi:hypothetical protein